MTMAKTGKQTAPDAEKPKAKRRKKRRIRPVRWIMRRVLLLLAFLAAVLVSLVLLFAVINPPINYYIWTESQRLGGVDREWVPMEDIAPVMARSAVAAEDANFCQHWGFDVAAIRAALAAGGSRGGSTISQQVVKNVFLWQGRNWSRKAMEAVLTPLVEAIWPKRRILEVYLNIAEFDEGVFGVEAAARHYFAVGPEALTPVQAARLAAILPSPKRRSAANPSALVRRKAVRIMDGAALIAKDGRAACFED